MGAVAFGGCNLLALLLFAAAWRPMTVVLRSQTVGSAVTSWLLAMAWTIGVVGLYRLDYVQAATLLLCAVTLLYVLCAWLIVSGRVPPEPPSENSPPDE